MRIAGAGLLIVACSYAPDPATSGDGPLRPDAVVDAPPPDAFMCPAGYALLAGAPAGSLYRVSGGAGNVVDNAGRSSWLEAQLDCANDGAGAHLAIAETEQEYKAFSDAVSGATRWLGVSDRKQEGTWIPIIGGTETSFIGHWFGGSPNGTCCDSSSDCMSLSGSQQSSPLGAINIAEGMPCADVTSGHVKGYICECDMHEVDPTTF